MLPRSTSGNGLFIRFAPGQWLPIGVFSYLVVVVVVGYQLGYRDVDIWGAFGMPILLFLLVSPFVTAVERRKGSNLAPALVAGLGVRFIGAYIRFLVSFYVYEAADSARYHQAAGLIVEQYRNGSIGPRDLIPTATGTQFIEQLAGLVQVIFGRSFLGTYNLCPGVHG